MRHGQAVLVRTRTEIVAELGGLEHLLREHDVRGISFLGKHLRLTADGRRYETDFSRESRRLATATSRQLRKHELSPAGFGIHWPELDEDPSIDGLVRAAVGKVATRAKP